MKTIKLASIALAGTLLFSSCETRNQMMGGLVGAQVGSQVGGAVGFLTGHGPFRGHNSAMGSLIGAGVGALLGVSVAQSIEDKEQARNNNYNNSGYNNNSTYNNSGYNSYSSGNYDYQTSGGSYNSNSTYSASGNIVISELTYMDTNGDGYISKGETIEVESYITNSSSYPVEDIVIYITTNDEKNYTISPSLTTTLQPGQKIRYKGRVYCNKAKEGQQIRINVNTSSAGVNNISPSLFVQNK